MIRKTILATFALLLVACTTFAQAGGTYTSDNSFRNNWFVSVGGGLNMYFGDHDKQADFGDRLSPAIDVAVGKWFTPVVGARLMYSGLSAKGATRWGVAHSTGEQIDGWGTGMYHSKFNFYNFQADALFNLCNAFKGYDEERLYNCSPYVGIGVIHTSDAPKETSVTGHFGILNTFRLNSALDFNVDLRSTFLSDDFDGEPGGRGEGMLSATIGFTYKFKARGWN